jgi:hypothetical protein
MFNRIKARLVKYLGEEKGQALIAVLAFLLIGSLTLPPILSHISTSLKTGRIYEERTDELYAADSGIEDALWLIKYDRLQSFFTDPDYDIYNFVTTWSYNLSDTINGLTANVSIENVWIPKGVSPLSPTQGRDIIESSKLMIAGTVDGETSYKIKINFYPGDGEEDDLMVESLGIWLPLGFTYVAGSSNLEAAPYYCTPDVSPHAGGQAVVWEFSSAPFQDFPGVDPEEVPMVSEITFGFNASEPGTSPTAISWIVTSGVSDVPLSWDADNKVYRIVSVAGEAEIEAYSVKCGLRKLGAAIEGDYRAIGNSLMIDTYPDSYDIRDELLDESDAEVSDIPSDAEAIAAFLYWSGWFEGGTPQPVLEDDCKDFGNWISGSCWNINDGHFRSHYSSGAPSTRYCTLKDSLDLSSHDPGMVKVCWEHWEEGSLEWWPPSSADALKFQFSGDGGENWSSTYTAFSGNIGDTPQHFSYTVPSAYLTSNFKFRFYLQNFGGDDEYCHVDNFAITETVCAADTSVIFKINGDQVYIDGQGDPQIDEDEIQEITASQSSILENEPGEYSYACYCDVTQLVKEFSNQGEHQNHTGNGVYTVGGVYAETGNQWSYAGWSLVIIYESPETYGHQLYLYDEFVYSDCNDYEIINVDFDGDGEPGGTITGFIVPEPIWGEKFAATLTCFVGEGDECWAPDSLKFNGDYLFNDESPWNNVWNSASPGMSEDGVDIDTFYITWDSHLLEPGDSSAQLDLLTKVDSWNLVYIILSLRSETITGGTVHYVIHNS